MTNRNTIILASALGLLALTQVPGMQRNLQFQECRSDLLSEDWAKSQGLADAQREITRNCGGY